MLAGNMTNIWKVKYSGKLDILLVSNFVIIVVYFLFVLRGAEGEGEDYTLSLIFGIVLFFLFWISAISVPFTLLRSKVFPKTLEIDKESNLITITYFKKISPTQLKFEDASYQIIENDYFTILVLYKKQIATRGHTLNLELFSLVSSYATTSWKKKQVYEIVNEFKKLNLQKYVPEKHKPFIDYLLG
jgi:hypothetical protein